MQARGKPRRVGVPVENVKRRRLVAQQVVVDPVVPDQIIRAHPGEHLGHVLPVQHAARLRHLLGRHHRFLRDESRHVIVRRAFGIENTNGQDDGIDLLFLLPGQPGGVGRNGDPART